MSFVCSKYPLIYKLAIWISFGSTTVLSIVLFTVRYIIVLFFTMDLFRCFIMLATLVMLGIQLFKNLIEFSYFDRVISLGRQNAMQHVRVYRHVQIIYRIPVELTKFSAFIAISFEGVSFVLFLYVVIRTHSNSPIILLLGCSFGVFVTMCVQIVVCNYGAYINQRSKNLLQKFKREVGNMGEARKRKEITRSVKSLQPVGLYVGLGWVTLFILDKDRKVFVLKQMLDYSIDTIMEWSKRFSKWVIWSGLLNFFITLDFGIFSQMSKY